ncbi:MAG: hypothetical protein V4537_00755 [Pseudomonadota bacterium]
MTLYSCFDFRFASEIPLGELTPASADDARPIVKIRYGRLPETLPGEDPVRGLQLDGERVLLRVRQVARFMMIGGREIVVDPEPGASDRTIRLFLLGSALGVLAYQRGLLPLHANAVVIDGAAHAFSGESGAGKSTLAAHFAASGHPVLCDDVCAVSFDDEGRPFAWPGLPRLKLWQDAADQFGHDTATLDRAIDGYEKFHVPLRAAGHAGPVPFARLYLLDRAEPGAGSRIDRLRGGEAMRMVMENSYRPGYVARMGLGAAHFRQCSSVVRHAAVFEARRGWGYDVFAQEAARLEAHVRDADMAS